MKGRLSPEEYGRLRLQVLRRDGWSCQQCGSRVALQIYHRQHRVRLGADTEENLITLCQEGHRQAHLR